MKPTPTVAEENKSLRKNGRCWCKGNFSENSESLTVRLKLKIKVKYSKLEKN